MRQLFPILVLVAGLLLCPPQTVTGQENPEASFGELVEVSEVLLDVLVTNKDGDVVLGLEPEDFVIVDDKTERPVTGADFYSNRFLMKEDAAGKIQHPPQDEIPSDRYFILFFHDQRRNDAGNFLFRRQMRAAKHAKRWIREEMLQGDWVAVLSYDYKLKVQTDFTQDRAQLEEAVRRASLGKDPSNEWSSRRQDLPEDTPSLLAHLPEGKELRDNSEHLYDGLSLAAEATRDIHGRKNLLLFTIGFGDIRNAAGGTGLSNGAVSRPDERYYPGLKASLNDNNVAVYPIDLTPSEWEHTQRDFLNVLAADTGGFYHFNFVSFMTPLRQIADEANGYYLLSYQAEHGSGESGYRNLKVKTRNPEFKVRARTGYRFGA